MIKILKYFKKIEWLQVALCLVFITGQVWLDLKLPDYMSEITLLVQTEGSSMSEIWSAGGYMLLCALGSLVASIIIGYFAARLAATLSYRLRMGLYNRVEAFSMEEIGRFSTSSLITRSTNDITQVQTLIAMGLQVMIKAPILAVWAIIKIAGKSWQWSVSTGGAVFALVILVTVLVVFALPKFKIVQQLTDNLNRVTRENLTGVRVVRAYNAENYQETKFKKANEEMTETNLFTNRIMAIMMPGMSLIMNGLTLSIYWIGAYLINGADIPDRLSLFSDMVVYSSYAMQVVMAFMMLVMIFIMLPRSAVSARRINEVLDTQPKITDGDMDSKPWGMGEVEFKNVSFQYPGAAEYVLKDVSFKAKSGETVAFIGSTGSGKSTLINLIPRFYDATEGQVLIDGVDIKKYKQKDLHNKIGYVPQRAVIFSGDIAGNVAFGNNGRKKAMKEDIENAASVAQAKDFIDNLPEKYQAPISQGGSNLSGGQKQRLAIARAICRQPEIFIFDDSFSALDYKTDKVLRTQLAAQTLGATTFIVAQRIGTIRNADRIIVLEEGNVVGIGKHEELLKTCKVYHEIAYSQLSKEELGDE
ncbi:ABC transporter ATP-binding protein [Anaerocolumna sp. AGMB13020]|uniref:ABC transporter ATP-binding protein n=1 Tax=Anaerocolumna sp. AGMB13020 TaxID=3081750 RepID=UPI0029535536|nr:ABC transporter ATP-binding protein [Anaerocolumna sp. AGMB13020]WOO37718.1 ABC transporter ATP-binding protein [Anaerocolumna sp. AGMB13020]